MKRAESGARSLSASQRYGSEDLDPYKNVTDPEHCQREPYSTLYLSSCILWKVMLTCGIWWRRTAQSPGRYSCWLCVITLVSWDILLKARVQFLSQQDFFPGPVTNSKRVLQKSLLHFKKTMKKVSCHGLMRPVHSYFMKSRPSRPGFDHIQNNHKQAGMLSQ